MQLEHHASVFLKGDFNPPSTKLLEAHVDTLLKLPNDLLAKHVVRVNSILNPCFPDNSVIGHDVK